VRPTYNLQTAEASIGWSVFIIVSQQIHGQGVLVSQVVPANVVYIPVLHVLPPSVQIMTQEKPVGIGSQFMPICVKAVAVLLFCRPNERPEGMQICF
jgi:hypothetical protein